MSETQTPEAPGGLTPEQMKTAADLNATLSEAGQHAAEVRGKWGDRVDSLQLAGTMPEGRHASIGDTAVGPFVELGGFIGTARAERREHKAHAASTQHYEENKGAYQEQALQDAAREGAQVEGWHPEDSPK